MRWRSWQPPQTLSPNGKGEDRQTGAGSVDDQGAGLDALRREEGTAPGRAKYATLPPELETVVIQACRGLREQLEAERLARMRSEEAEQAVRLAAQEYLTREQPHLSASARAQVAERLVAELLGLGPLEPLLRDPSVSEIMVNAPDEVYVEREGKLLLTDIRLWDRQHVLQVADRILAAVGRRVDEASPMADARLPDGSRVNVIIPPLSPRSPVITIRRFRGDRMRMEDLLTVGALTEEAAAFLAACVRARLNILVSGGTGTGKTTLLNALSGFIPHGERVITIEDPIELRLQQPHVVQLEARPAGVEGTGEVTQRDLLRNALRMRPDRIIVGEVRGGEAFDMLNAMNTGHEGSMSTVHANSPRDALHRLENMVLMAVDLPQRAIREQIASALHIIVQAARLADGRRVVARIVEVTGMEESVIGLQDIFVFERRGRDASGRVLGELRWSGLRPQCAREIETAGERLPPSMGMAEPLATERGF